MVVGTKRRVVCSMKFELFRIVLVLAAFATVVYWCGPCFMPCLELTGDVLEAAQRLNKGH